MTKAIWNKKTIAESEECIIVGGKHYFPPNSIKKEYLEHSDTKTTCAWKGEAKYHNIIVDGKKNEDAAWYYPNPSKAAHKIKNYVSFWKGVEIMD